MSSISVAGDTSGSISITAPLVAGSSVLTLPVATDTLIGKATTDTLTNKTLTAPAISSAVMTTMASSVLTSATAQASTSGTSIDFTSIPSWVKRITVMFNGVSISGTSSLLIQLGAGSVTSTGYASVGNAFNQASGTAGVNSTSGFPMYIALASGALLGHMTLTNVNSNIWVSSHSGTAGTSTTSAIAGGGNVTLSGALDRVRITTVNGTDTFDAGSINIMYE